MIKMEQTSFTERLMEFGLTRQEASIYQCLLTEGKVTGYEEYLGLKHIILSQV